MRQVSLGSVLAQGLLIALVVAMVVLFVLPTLGTAASYSVSKAEGHLEAGTRYLSEGRVDEAIQELTSGVRANPTSADLQFQLGNAFYQILKPVQEVVS